MHPCSQLDCSTAARERESERERGGERARGSTGLASRLSPVFPTEERERGIERESARENQSERERHREREREKERERERERERRREREKETRCGRACKLTSGNPFQDFDVGYFGAGGREATFQKSILDRVCQLLAIRAHKMAPRTRQGLQKRAWDTPTYGLLWYVGAGGREAAFGRWVRLPWDHHRAGLVGLG